MRAQKQADAHWGWKPDNRNPSRSKEKSLKPANIRDAAFTDISLNVCELGDDCSATLGVAYKVEPHGDAQPMKRAAHSHTPIEQHFHASQSILPPASALPLTFFRCNRFRAFPDFDISNFSCGATVHTVEHRLYQDEETQFVPVSLLGLRVRVRFCLCVFEQERSLLQENAQWEPLKNIKLNSKKQ